MSLKMQVLIAGIRVKIDRGMDLEDILAAYVNLSDTEKQEIRDRLA